MPKDPDCAQRLKACTLTNLYNQRPAWRDLAHKKLDEAAFAAYGWTATMTDDEILEKLLGINLARAREYERLLCLAPLGLMEFSRLFAGALP